MHYAPEHEVDLPFSTHSNREVTSVTYQTTHIVHSIRRTTAVRIGFVVTAFFTV